MSKGRKGEHFPSPEVLSRLASETGDFAPLFFLSGRLGLRWGEVRGLNRKRLNILRSEVVIEEQLIEPQGHIHFAALKTEASRRKLRIPVFLSDVVRHHLAQRNCGAHDLVFVGSDGAPLRDQLD